MRLLVCLLVSVAAGFATYLVGAVVWTIIDPQSAARVLLFTIPVAITGTILPALLATAAALLSRRSAA